MKNLLSSRFAATLSFALLAGCDTPATEPTDTDNSGPLYVMTAQVLAKDPAVSYLVVTNKVDEVATLSHENSIVIPNRALGVGLPKTGSIFVGQDEGATLTRYTLSSSGKLEENGSINFTGVGVQSIGEYQNNFQFVSETKAYYFDGTTAQIIVWNPKELTITKRIALEGMTVEGAGPVFSASPVTRAHQIVMPVGWRTRAAVIKMAGVVVVDKNTDTATVVKDDRCGYAHSSVLGADGQVYLATEVYGAAAYRVAADKNPAGCMLKFNPDTLKFDPSFYKAMNSLTGGAATGGLLPTGTPGSAYIRVLDESIPAATSYSDARTLASGTGWQWWKLDLSTFAATKLAAYPATTGSTFLYQAEGRTLYSEFAAGSASTTLHLLDDNGKPTVTTEGLAFSFLQVR